MSKTPHAPAVRLAQAADAAAIEAIYAPYVLGSTCTYQRDPDPPGYRASWLASRSELHPVTVAELGGEVVGWGCLSSFRDRWGYRFTVENSVYVREGLHRRGVGSALLEDLIERARALGHHTIIAGVSAEQEGSIRLHERFGFREAARLRQVGHKLDRWLDVVFLQLMLAEGGAPRER